MKNTLKFILKTISIITCVCLVHTQVAFAYDLRITINDDIIKEANLIEEAFREDGASAEIISNHVLQAVRKNKTNHHRKPNRFLIITKIISSLSLLVTGFLFDSAGYQNNVGKLIAFIVCLIVASVSTVLQFVLEDRE